MMIMVMSMGAVTVLLQMKIRLSCGQVVLQTTNNEEVIRDLMTIMKTKVVLGRWFGHQLQLNLIISIVPVGIKTPTLKMIKLWRGHRQTIKLQLSILRGAKVSDKCATKIMTKMRKIKELLGVPYSKTSITTTNSSNRVGMLKITIWAVGGEPRLYLSPTNDKTITAIGWWLTNMVRCPPRVSQQRLVLDPLGFPQATMLICKTLYLLFWFRNKIWRMNLVKLPLKLAQNSNCNRSSNLKCNLN